MVLPFDDRRSLRLGGRYLAHSTRHEVLFRGCGQAIGLHPVSADGHLQMYLRALHGDALHWLVVDVRHLVPELADDMPRHESRDHPGLVFYSLRGRYGTAQACLQAAREAALWQGRAEPLLEAA